MRNITEEIEDVLNNRVRPKLASHGGDVSVAALDDQGILWVEMLGQCAGCPAADSTVQDLIESELVGRIPGIKRVEIDSGIDADVISEVMKLMTHPSN